MAIGTLEIDAASAIVVIDLARPGLRGIGPIGEPFLLYASEYLIELGVADQKRVMLGSDLAALFQKIDVYAV